MANDARATYDQAVIDAWAAALQRQRRALRSWWALLAIVFTASLVLTVALHDMRWYVVTFVAVYAAIGTKIAKTRLLPCPHCKRRSATVAKFGEGDFCRHCRYWLVSPHAKGEGR